MSFTISADNLDSIFKIKYFLLLFLCGYLLLMYKIVDHQKNNIWDFLNWQLIPFYLFCYNRIIQFTTTIIYASLHKIMLLHTIYARNKLD